MELNRIKLDTDKLERGVWWQIEATQDGRVTGEPVPEPKDGEASLLIRPIGTAYQRALEDAQAPHREAIRAGKLDPALRRQIMAEALAAAVLVDWRGLTLSGEALAYDAETATNLLGDESWLSLAEFVTDVASFRAAALAAEEEAASGN